VADAAGAADACRVVKLGAGRTVADGDTIVVHLRTAQRIEDLHDDARVLHSTYSAGEPLTVKFDADVLLPEVYAGLLGRPAGSTVVVRLADRWNPDTTPGPERSAFLEIWVEDARPSDAQVVETLASRDVVRAEPAGQQIAAALRAAHSQANGYAVTIPASAEQEFHSACGAAAADGHVTRPKRLGDRATTDSTLSFLVSRQLYERLMTILGR
jgi:hypothetical protein